MAPRLTDRLPTPSYISGFGTGHEKSKKSNDKKLPIPEVFFGQQKIQKETPSDSLKGRTAPINMSDLITQAKTKISNKQMTCHKIKKIDHIILSLCAIVFISSIIFMIATGGLLIPLIIGASAVSIYALSSIAIEELRGNAEISIHQQEFKLHQLYESQQAKN